MLKLISLLIAGFITAPVSMAETKELNHLPRNLFIPNGYDDNDNVEVILEGSMPTSCLLSGPIEIVKRETSEKTITLRHIVYKIPGSKCLLMEAQYMKQVDLGRLPAGEYTVNILDEAGKTGKSEKLKVAKSKTSATDNALYAPVSGVSIQYPKGADPQITLSGTFTTSCASFEDIKVIKDQENVAVVFPVLRHLTLPNCVNITNHFSYVVDIPFDLAPVSLIHVRAYNGRSVNIIGDFGPQ